jgi:hypothetical protein
MVRTAARDIQAGSGAREVTETNPSAGARLDMSKFWQALCLIIAVFVSATTGELAIWQAGLENVPGSLGATLGPAPEPGFMTVLKVLPGSPLTGVVPGDGVRLDPPYLATMRHAPGEKLAVVVDHKGRQTRREVVTVAAFASEVSNPRNAALLIALVTAQIDILIGALIVWRSRGRTAALLLGAGLIVYGLYAYILPLTHATPGLIAAWTVATSAVYSSICPLFLAFAMRFVADSVGPRRTWEWWMLAAIATVAVVTTVVFRLATTFAVWGPVVRFGWPVMTLVQFAGFVIAFGYLFHGWRRSAYATQQRHALMLVATAAIIASQVAELFLSSRMSDTAYATTTVIAALLSGVLAPALFLYAIFRQRVFDLGFAINRTVVYGAVSAILLMAFGLLEWAFEHPLPIMSHETSALVSAGVALGLFLVFHRLRDAAEHVIKSLFFRRWQAKETALRRFIEEARHINSDVSLEGAAVAALQRFCEGADCALYRADDKGDYELRFGHVAGGPGIIGADAPDVVSLRARLAVVETPSSSGPSTVFVLPMTHRAQVTGAILVGPKPGGASYRPDERDLLAWATHQVGLDLHALRLDQVQREAEGLRRSAHTLEARYGELEKAFRFATGRA